MKMKKTALVAAMSLGVVFGAAQANAYVYARSYFDTDNLQLGAVNADGSPAAATILSYTNVITNTASINGVNVPATGGTCNYSGGLSCPVLTTPVLDSAPAEAGTIVSTGNNDFSFYGPDNLNQYARADNVVNTAAVIQIRDGISPAIAHTDVDAIAEAQLLTGAAASSQSQIQSTTGFSLVFNLLAGGNFFINFDAVWDQLVDIDTSFQGGANAATAQSQLEVSARLDGPNGEQLTWQVGDFCFSDFGACGVVHGGDLNRLINTSIDPNTISNAGSGNFNMFATGLASGQWTFALNSTVRTALSQDIPLPGTLVLLGLGLVSMGMAGRRRRGMQRAS
jgi:hypothetical protein